MIGNQSSQKWSVEAGACDGADGGKNRVSCSQEGNKPAGGLSSSPVGGPFLADLTFLFLKLCFKCTVLTEINDYLFCLNKKRVTNVTWYM